MRFPGLSQSLMDVLRKRIITSELGPGQRISEIDLANEIGISRSPIREAFRTLETEGLVDYVPRKGNSVSTISLQDLSEIYRVREMAECFAIDLLKENSTDNFAALDECLERTSSISVPSKEASNETKLQYVETLSEFHYELVRACSNRRLLNIYKTIYSNIKRYVFLYAFNKGIREHRVQDHLEILSCLKKGDYDRARQTALSHIRNSCDDCRYS